MKTKLTRILGVAMTVALLVGLFVTAAPLSAGDNSWTKFGVPSATGMVLDGGDATGPWTMGSDGTIWAGRGSGNTGTLIKSADFGATWAANTAYTALSTGTNIMDIVVSSIDPLQVYVTDGVDIYKTADGGTTWVTLSALGTGGWPLITSIDVGYIGANAYIFAATSTFGSGDGGVFVAQEAVFGMPWTDMLIGTDRATAWETLSGTIGGADVTEVMVDPINFGTSQMVMAVVTTDTVAGGGYTENAAIVTTKYGGAQWGSTVADVTLYAATTALWNSSTWLPDDYSSNLASGTMQVFVGVNPMAAAEGDVFWVVFGTPGQAFGLNVNGGGFAVSSLDGIGTGASAQMLASGYASGTFDTPVVMASSVGGAIWTANTKAPTGSDTNLAPGDAVSEVMIDPVTGNAIVATHGDDSAVSFSSDWAVWNGISLINATITNINDLFVNDNFVAMVTDDGSIDSLWTRAAGSTTWQRILSSATFNNPFDMYEFAGGAAFLADSGNNVIYRSLNGGATWAPLVSVAPENVEQGAWVVLDANTILVAGDEVIHQTTNGGVIWFDRTAALDGAGTNLWTSLAVSSTGDILAGGIDGTAGEVALSIDGGASWTVSTDKITAMGTAIIVALGATGTMYATGDVGGDAGVWKRTTGSWSQIDKVTVVGNSPQTSGDDVPVGVGLVTGPGVEEMVYAADGSAAEEGVLRIKSNRTEGDKMSGPDSSTFMGLWYGNGALWTVDTTGDEIYTWTDTMNVAGSGVSATATGTTTATASWTPLTDATGYLVTVNTSAKSNYFTATTLGTVVVTTSSASAVISGLTAGTAYIVNVWATDGGTSSFVFNSGSFSTNLPPVSGPVSLAPAAGAANVPVMPTFQWNPPTAGATPTGYLLEVSTVSDFATTILSVALPSAETYYAWQGSALDYGTVYYWRVTASGVSSSVPVSSVFTTEAEPVDPVDVITPTTPNITLTVPAAETPAYIWAIIAVGFVLTLAVIILIVRTRRVV